MSHFSTVTTKLTNRECLVQALQDLQLTVQVYEKPLGIVQGDRTYKPESQQQLRSIITHQQRLHQ